MIVRRRILGSCVKAVAISRGVKQKFWVDVILSKIRVYGNTIKDVLRITRRADGW